MTLDGKMITYIDIFPSICFVLVSEGGTCYFPVNNLFNL